VRKNLIHFLNHDFDYLVFERRPIIPDGFSSHGRTHVETGADITVATIPVGRREAQSFGIMQIAEDRRITRFEEKPKDPRC